MKKITLAILVVSLLELLSACGSGGGGGKDGDVGIIATPVPATGQTISYVDFDDGYYKDFHTMFFTDNGDGTIKDDVTGLLWQKDLINGVNWYQATGTYDLTYNSSSANSCSSFGAGWRLPTRFELMTIANYGAYSPAIYSGFFIVHSNAFWTSSAPATNLGWTIHFYDGSTWHLDKTESADVRCVSGTPFMTGNSLLDNGNGTVTDLATNLMWQKCGLGQNNDTTCSDNVAEPDYVDWLTAISYCNGLDRGGFTDWRVPNIKELNSIADFTRTPAINMSYFPNTGGIYWSSSSRAENPDYGWGLNFPYTGMMTFDSKTKTNYVRCVRGG